MNVMSVRMLLSLSMLEVVPRLVENWCHLRDTGPCGSMLHFLAVLCNINNLSAIKSTSQASIYGNSKPGPDIL